MKRSGFFTTKDDGAASSSTASTERRRSPELGVGAISAAAIANSRLERLDMRDMVTIGQQQNFVFVPSERSSDIGFKRAEITDWGLPFPNDDHFVGQEQWLVRIAEQLTGPVQAERISLVGIVGMGGVGKTSLANMVIHHPPKEYTFRTWIDASSEAGIQHAYRNLSGILLNNPSNIDDTAKCELVKQWFEQGENAGWLMVYDDAQSFASLKKYLPQKGGQVLITSRNTRWAMGQMITIDVMDLIDAMELAKRILYPDEQKKVSVEEVKELEKLDKGESQQSERLKELTELKSLVETLGRLPLAISHACSCIRASFVIRGIPEYLERYNTVDRKYLLASRDFLGDDAHETVYCTWQISILEIVERNPLAVKLLAICAYLNVSAIEKCWFTSSFQLDDGTGMSDLQIAGALEILSSYSLLKKDPETRGFSIHPLVQNVMQERDKEEDGIPTLRPYFGIRNAVSLIQAQMVYDRYNVETFEAAKRILPHAQALLRTLFSDDARLVEAVNDPISLTRIAIKVSDDLLFHERLPDFTVPREYLEHAKTAIERVAERDDTLVLWGEIYNYLAFIYYRECPELAESYCRKSAECYVELYQKSLDDTGATCALCIQGYILQYKNDFIGIPSNREQVTSLFRDLLYTAMRLEVAVQYTVLGGHDQSSVMQRFYPQKIKFHQIAREIREKISGEDKLYPELAAILANYARALQKKNYSFRLEEVKEYYLHSLKVYRLLAKNSEIAGILLKLGDLWSEGWVSCELAEGYYKESLEIFSKLANGCKIFEIAHIYARLGDIYRNQSKYNAASKCYRQALDNFPDPSIEQQAIADILHNLGDVYAKLLEYDQAKKFYHQTLGIRRVLEKEHPTSKLVSVLACLGEVCYRQVQHEDAQKHYKEALEVVSALQQIESHIDKLKKLERECIKQARFKSVNQLLIRGDYSLAMEKYREDLGLYYAFGLTDVIDGLQCIKRSCFEFANQLFFRGNYLLALPYYQLVLSAYKIDGRKDYDMCIAEVLSKIGECYFKQNNFIEAEGFYRQAIDVYGAIPECPSLLEKISANVVECGDDAKHLWEFMIDYDYYNGSIVLYRQWGFHLPIYIAFEHPQVSRVYIYSSLHYEHIEDHMIRLRCYEHLLDSTWLRRQMAGGRIYRRKEAIDICWTLYMHNTDSSMLRQFGPIIEQSIHRWWERWQAICDGFDIDEISAHAQDSGTSNTWWKSIQEKKTEILVVLKECSLKLGNLEQAGNYQRQLDAINFARQLPFAQAQTDLAGFGVSLSFDGDNTCVLKLPDGFPVHFVFESYSSQLYIYAPLLHGLPEDNLVRLTLYETLLNRWSEAEGGCDTGVGINTSENVVTMYVALHVPQYTTGTLQKLMPSFTRVVKEWRERCAMICSDISTEQNEHELALDTIMTSPS